MAADLAFLTCLHGPQHDAVPCAKTRYRSRTEEARGSNPLTSTPNPAGQSVASVEPAALAVCWGRPGAANRPGRVPEAVNLYEAPASGNYWAASSVSGLLIHAVVGSLGGWGSLRTNRSGWAA